ncbi:hypothetical protein [Mucilaginibacter jinjuensis]|uniref:Baseplate J-like protein n=1 Tax=Mucilaginibacter jinjuensis TaxID=1176721 RepID=A0ABY7T170_9SPHI|nr:hypothetical protein [Mucilaginibacter jinjuensis]WCT10023.1 hypothetical protein PQO05_14920 [Mucilaginibacter jinjuensis]
MESPNYILDVQLPITQDFKSLKSEALAYIQQHSGNEWTNLNASDPGVTILDQFCFALTELGYCNNFSVSDILTKPNGDLRVKNQFYLPEDILTTSPVTIIDYRKYVIDGIAPVNNAVIVPATNELSVISSIYQTYLLIDESITDGKTINDVCIAAFYYLNKNRNLGEIFLKPLPLQPVIQLVKGRIDIDNVKNLTTILSLIQDAVDNYIFPKIVPTGYDQLIAEGARSNIIYNGPLLDNGWISSDDLTDKRTQVYTIDLAHLIEDIKGVNAVSALSFTDTEKPTGSIIVTSSGQLLKIDIPKSVVHGLDIYCNGVKVQTESAALSPTILKSQQQDVSVVFGSTIDTEPALPRGKYRDINDYYSIQNTFPEIFGVGINGIDSNALDYQIAQSRQLKGYLTLFDQVLANQFSQLANVHRLFSFKNSLAGTPSDRANYYEEKDKYQREHGEYPVPYKVFSPTYFYQSLYDVPYIKPLLKNSNAFSFSMAIESDEQLDIDGWAAYKDDPYNPYIKGLMDFMEDETDSLTRRNDMLDHLLARHGESPMVVNAVINGSVYSGNSLKDQVIFKSLYLQNLGLLSYYRQRAYNYSGAHKISAEIPVLSPEDEEIILSGYTNDFIFNSKEIDKAEKLTEQDFINYSSIELKLNLLFGLKVAYKDFIAASYDNVANAGDIGLALWLMQERKGFLLIETNLLAQFADLVIIIKDDTTNMSWKIGDTFNYDQAVIIDRVLRLNPPVNVATQLQNGSLVISNTSFTAARQTSESTNKTWKPIQGTGYSFNVQISSGPEIGSFEDSPLFANRLELVFPAFIPAFNTLDFKNRLDLFLQDNLPVQTAYKYHFVEAAALKNWIPAFTNWHNSITYQSKVTTEIVTSQSEYTGILTTLLTELNLTDNE